MTKFQAMSIKVEEMNRANQSSHLRQAMSKATVKKTATESQRKATNIWANWPPGDKGLESRPGQINLPFIAGVNDILTGVDDEQADQDEGDQRPGDTDEPDGTAA